MQIAELVLHTQNREKQSQFYTQTLGLTPVQSDANSFTVQAGATRLTFRLTEEKTLYHFAFTIPSNQIEAARTWLTARVPLLTLNGQEMFSSAHWNSDSLYFCDPDGHILELITHHDLRNDSASPFGPQSILHISEIGMAFENVAEQLKVWQTRFGFTPYRNSVEEMFAAVGDINGLFITVQTGRHWFPTSIPSLVSPVHVTIKGLEAGSHALAPYPYKIDVRSE